MMQKARFAASGWDVFECDGHDPDDIDRALTADDLSAADLAVVAIEHAVNHQLARTPFIFRKAGASPFWRELIIPSRGRGYVVLYEVENAHLPS